ncbi:MAG: hypothetical protein AB2705_04610 [Candidatus Thiodiazotropha sp.]
MDSEIKQESENPNRITSAANQALIKANLQALNASRSHPAYRIGNGG